MTAKIDQKLVGQLGSRMVSIENSVFNDAKGQTGNLRPYLGANRVAKKHNIVSKGSKKIKGGGCDPTSKGSKKIKRVGPAALSLETRVPKKQKKQNDCKKQKSKMTAKSKKAKQVRPN